MTTLVRLWTKSRLFQYLRRKPAKKNTGIIIKFWKLVKRSLEITLFLISSTVKLALK